jgi:putative colanic acid biosynthesis acetyltransferase WcaF
MREKAQPAVDVAANRSAKKYSRAENAARVAWAVARPLFRFSPRPLFGWRRAMLRALGAKLAAGAHLYADVEVYFPWNLEMGEGAAVGEGARLYNLGPLRIGARATIPRGAHLCGGTHDLEKPDLPLVKAPIVVEEDAWIGADAFIGPGVTVGRGAVVGARAVVVQDVPPWTIVAGNPARKIGKRELRER